LISLFSAIFAKLFTCLDLLVLSRVFGSLKKIFGYRFVSTEALKEVEPTKRKSFFGRTSNSLDLDIQFTYSAKYGIHVRCVSEVSLVMLQELQKVLDRTVSKCSNLKLLLLGHLNNCLFTGKNSDKIVFYFDKLNSIFLLSQFPKSLARAVLKNKDRNLSTKPGLDEIFKSRILKDYIRVTVSQLRNQQHGIPMHDHPNASIRIDYSGSQHSYKGFYLMIDEHTLCSLENDPDGVLKETKALLEYSKPQARNLKQLRRKKVGFLSTEEGGLNNIFSDESLGKFESIPSMNQNDLMIDEINAKLKKNVQSQVEEHKKAKIWSLRQTMKNLSDDSIDLNLDQESKKAKQDTESVGLREIGKSYAMEYFPNGFNDKTKKQFSMTSDRQPTLTEKLNDRESARQSISLPRSSLIDSKYTQENIEECSREFTDENIRDWNYDILKLSGLQEFGFVLKIFAPYLSHFEVDQSLFLNFVQTLKRKYNKNNNSFHNFKHGIAVAFSSNYFLKTVPHIEDNYTQAVQFAFVVASLGHDVGHTGRNNNYEINSRSKLALRYNDRSPLEQHHIAKLFSVIFKHNINIFESFSAESFNEIRHTIIECILATDMKVHFTLLSKFESIVNKNEVVGCKDFKELVLCILIHAADISASTRKAPIATEWSKLVSVEFTNQYNLETEQSLPVTAYFKDLHIPLNFYKSECGFLNFIVKPLYVALRNYNFDMEETQDPKNNAQMVIPSRSKQLNCPVSVENPFFRIMELIDENVRFYEGKLAMINLEHA
jgi:hypothetical protein